MHKTRHSPVLVTEEFILTVVISVYTLVNGSIINKGQKLFSDYDFNQS